MENTIYAKEAGKHGSPDTYYRKMGTTITEAWHSEYTYTIAVLLDRETDLTSFTPCSASEFNEVMKQILTIINDNNK